MASCSVKTSNMVFNVIRKLKECQPKALFRQFSFQFPHHRRYCRSYNCRYHRRGRQSSRSSHKEEENLLPEPVPLEYFINRVKEDKTRGMNLRRIHIFGEILEIYEQQRDMFEHMRRKIRGDNRNNCTVSS